MKILLLAIASFQIVVIISCSHKNDKPNIEKVLTDVVARYSQLPKGENGQESFYQLIRSVTIGNTGIELQLRSSPDSLNDPQEIIIFINREKDKYAVPLFSNTYHDYWNFEFDSVLTSVKRINTTFDKELQTCLQRLELHDSSGTASIVIHEMLFSLLQCEQVKENDSINLIPFPAMSNYDLPDENSDSCFKRNKKNWQAISKEMHSQEYIINYNAFWDRKNHRVYQLDPLSPTQKGQFKFTFKTYRLDCISHMINI